MKKTILLVLLFSLALFPIISATQIQISPSIESYVINYPKLESITANENFTFTIYVNYNNGSTLTKIPLTNNVSCTLHGINSAGVEVLNENFTKDDEIKYSLLVNGDYLFLGQGYYFVSCVDQNGLTGTVSADFDITSNGKNDINNLIFYILIIIFSYTINLLGFFKRSAWITILGGIALIFTGLFMLQNGIIIYRESLTLAFSYITLFWGAGSSLWAAVEVIQDNL